MRTLAALLIEANKNNEIDQTCRRSERRENIRGDCMARCIGHVNWSVSQSIRPSVRLMSLKIKIGDFDCKGNTMEFSESFVCQSLTHTHSQAICVKHISEAVKY